MAVIATGFFDGVHIGHIKVVKTLVSFARKRGEEALVITFSRHPRAVLQQDARSLKLLSSTEEKIGMLKSAGADRVEVLDFSKEFASMTAREYLSEVVQKRFGGTMVVLGYDNRFGSDKLQPEEIASIATELGLESVIVSAELVGKEETKVSSTKIRTVLSDGEIETAALMLGYDYYLHGVVVPGKQLGRTIGFPTANMLMYEPLKMLPAKGVYLTEVEALKKRHYGMTNIGDIVETHIFDFDEDIYGLDIVIKFKKRLRDEKRLDSIEKLKSQLAIDEGICRALCEDLPRL